MSRGLLFLGIALLSATLSNANPKPETAPRYNWWPYVVDTAKEAGQGTAVRVDPDNGKIHIAYRQNRAIKYAVGKPGDWKLSVVADTCCDYGARPEMALDKDGNPNVLYSNWDCTKLTLARLKNGAWSKCLIDGDVDENECYKFSIERGPDDCMHILYAANRMIDSLQVQRPAYAKVCGDGCATGVELYKKHGGKWDALAFDSDGNPAAAWFTHDMYDLEFGVKRASDPWKLEYVLDSSWAKAGGIAIAMKYGEDNKFRIAHNDGGRKQFVLVTGNPGDWAEEMIDTILPAKDNSGQPAFILDIKPFSATNPMVLDTGDIPLIARYDWVNQDLGLLYKTGGEWYRSLVDSAGKVGLHASMDMDTDGRPVVAYYNETRGALMLAVARDSVPPDTNENGVPDYQEVRIKPFKSKLKLKPGRGKVKVYNLKGDLLLSFETAGADWKSDFHRAQERGSLARTPGNGLLVLEFLGKDGLAQRVLAASLSD